mgnify:CR=1 FL=1
MSTSFGISIPRVNPYTGQTETCYAYAADIHFVPADNAGRVVLHVHSTKTAADAGCQPIDSLVIDLPASRTDGGPTFPAQVSAHPEIYGGLAAAVQALALSVFPTASAYA